MMADDVETACRSGPAEATNAIASASDTTAHSAMATPSSQRRRGSAPSAERQHGAAGEQRQRRIERQDVMRQLGRHQLEHDPDRHRARR